MRRQDFPNIGVVTDILQHDLMSRMKTRTTEIIDSGFTGQQLWSSSLAGNIVKEYVFNDFKDEIEKHVIAMARFHEEQYKCFHLLVTNKGLTNLKLASMWVNFQQKYEYNPMHFHDGVYSFVIWLTIPYRKEIELEHSPGINSVMNRAGMFEFVYTNSMGFTCSNLMPVDSTWDGTICVFPAKLNHVVYPFFSSNGYRVTISGNLINY
jgi:hypothetical protein